MTGAPQPHRTLRILDATAIVVGIVIGAGIFKTPSLVAANTPNEWMLLGAWLLGGVVSLIGALCYAELATAYPHAGGDYHFLRRAFGANVSFLFAWARISVIQTGSIALLAFVFGDYLATVFSVGPYSTPLYAALVVIVLTALNASGLKHGSRAQNVLTHIEVLGLVFIAIAGLAWAAPTSDAVPAAAPAVSMEPAFGMAMVMVLLTYGGWNEAAYVSSEIRGFPRNVVYALCASIGLVTLLYVLVNIAYLHGLGLAGMAQSDTIAADLMRNALGDTGALWVGALVAVAALTSINATMITGARMTYAFGQDYAVLGFMGRWNARASTPVNALIVQALVALALVGLGTLTRQGFSTVVEYTAPVFWLFFFLAGLSLFWLRAKDPRTPRPFRVPFYPLTPLLFCATCLYMLASSLAYTGIGALVGVAVLVLGIPLLIGARNSNSKRSYYNDAQTPSLVGHPLRGGIDKRG